MEIRRTRIANIYTEIGRLDDCFRYLQLNVKGGEAGLQKIQENIEQAKDRTKNGLRTLEEANRNESSMDWPEFDKGILGLEDLMGQCKKYYASWAHEDSHLDGESRAAFDREQELGFW